MKSKPTQTLTKSLVWLVSGFFTTAVQRELGSAMSMLRNRIQSLIQTPYPKGLERESPEIMDLQHLSRQSCRLLGTTKKGRYHQHYNDRLS